MFLNHRNSRKFGSIEITLGPFKTIMDTIGVLKGFSSAGLANRHGERWKSTNRL